MSFVSKPSILAGAAVIVTVLLAGLVLFAAFIRSSTFLWWIYPAVSGVYIVFIGVMVLGLPMVRPGNAAFLAHLGLSALMVIVSCAVVYLVWGLEGNPNPSTSEVLYFSAVTFSTLGFGDLQPAAGTSRFFAASEAIIGNLHLALLAAVGFAIFARAESKSDNSLACQAQRLVDLNGEVQKRKAELAEVCAKLKSLRAEETDPGSREHIDGDLNKDADKNPE